MRPAEIQGKSTATASTTGFADAWWFSRDADEVIDRIDSDVKQGLSGEVAAQRLAENGPNQLQVMGHRSVLRRLLGQFTNPLIVVLIMAGVGTLLLQHPLDAAVIFVVVAI